MKSDRKGIILALLTCVLVTIIVYVCAWPEPTVTLIMRLPVTKPQVTLGIIIH